MKAKKIKLEPRRITVFKPTAKISRETTTVGTDPGNPTITMTKTSIIWE